MQLLVASLLAVCLAALVATASPSNYPEYEPSFNDMYGSGAEQIIYGPQLKRNDCVPRGGNCDRDPGECCEGTACRCNLWGANCRCQRKGLFG